MKSISLKLFSALSAMILFASCDKKDNNDDDNNQDENQARVMVVHASPDAPGVDLYVDNKKANATALTYPNNTGYINVNEGTRNIKVTLAGSTTPLYEVAVPFTAQTKASIFAYNRVTSPGLFMVTDQLNAPASGQVHIRFFHLAPDAPAVSVGTVSNNTFTAIPAFSNRSFENQSTATANQGFTSMAAGNYTFEVRNASNNAVVFTTPSITLQAGKIYTIYTRGIPGASGNQALNVSVITHN